MIRYEENYNSNQGCFFDCMEGNEIKGYTKIIDIDKFEKICTMTYRDKWKYPHWADPLHVYILKAHHKNWIKLGVSIDPERRVIEVKRNTPFELSPTHIIKFNNGKVARVIEAMFQRSNKISKPKIE